MKILKQRCQSMALLVALTTFVLQLTAVAQNEAQREQMEATQAKQALVEKIPVPADRQAIAGSYQLGADRISVSAGEQYDMQVLLSLMEGNSRKPVTAEDAWARIMLNGWTSALELHVGANELESRLRTASPQIYKGLLDRWAALGVSEEAGVAYEKSQIKISHLKNLLFSSNRTTTMDAFDQFKTSKLQYQFEYICFKARDFTEGMKKNGISDEELESFWKQDRGVAARFRLPANVSGGIVSFNPQDFTPEQVAQFGDSSKVTRQRALAYFKANEKRLVASIPANKRHLLAINDKTPIEQVVSPFSLVKDEIMKKLTLEHLISDAHMAARSAGAKADLEAISKKYNLRYRKFHELDRRGAMEQLKEFGIPAFSQLFGMPIGQVSPQLSIVGDMRFFAIVTDRKDSRLPELADVREKVRDFYIETRSSQLAREAAKEIFDEMEAKVSTLLEPDRLRLEAEGKEAAEREIKQMNYTREADKRRAHARAKGRMRLPLDKKKKEIMPGIFNEIIARRKLPTTKTPYFEFSIQREDRASMKDDDQSRLLFLTTSYQVRSLPKGGVTTMILEDHLTHSFILGRLVDKKDPELSTMGPVDLIQAQGQVKQISQARFPRQFQFAQLKEQFNFSVGK